MTSTRLEKKKEVSSKDEVSLEPTVELSSDKRGGADLV